MPEFCFYKRGAHITALESSNVEKSTHLIKEGWEKLFEEVSAADEESALARLADMLKEETNTEQGFVTGTAFGSFITNILK